MRFSRVVNIPKPKCFPKKGPHFTSVLSQTFAEENLMNPSLNVMQYALPNVIWEESQDPVNLN